MRLYRCQYCRYYYYQNEAPKKCQCGNVPTLSFKDIELTPGQIKLMVMLNTQVDAEVRLRALGSMEIQPQPNTKFYLTKDYRLVDEDGLFYNLLNRINFRPKPENYCLNCEKTIKKVTDFGLCPECHKEWIYVNIWDNSTYSFGKLSSFQSYLVAAILEQFDFNTSNAERMLSHISLDDLKRRMRSAIEIIPLEVFTDQNRSQRERGYGHGNVIIKYEINFAPKLLGYVELALMNEVITRENYNHIFNFVQAINNLSDRHRIYLEEEKKFVEKHLARFIQERRDAENIEEKHILSEVQDHGRRKNTNGTE